MCPKPEMDPIVATDSVRDSKMSRPATRRPAQESWFGAAALSANYAKNKQTLLSDTTPANLPQIDVNSVAPDST